ncbi:hypothetical protein A2U01_0028907, partial [Trifolium medium]|nr:hypothetical protein [Trifolium medium]
FNSMATSDLRKLALNHETSRAEKTAEEMGLRHTEAEKKYTEHIEGLKSVQLEEIAKLKGKHEEALATAKNDLEDLKKTHAEEKSSLMKEIRLLTLVRNVFMVSLFQIGRQVWDLQADVEELEEDNEALKQSMADKYFDEFQSVVDQVKALFPDLDPEILSQVDVSEALIL